MTKTVLKISGSYQTDAGKITANGSIQVLGGTLQAANENVKILGPDGSQIWPPLAVAITAAAAAVETGNLNIITFTAEQLAEALRAIPKSAKPRFITDGQGNRHDEAFGWYENGRAIMTPGVMPAMTEFLETVEARNAHMDDCKFNRQGRTYDWPDEGQAARLDELQSAGDFKELFAGNRFEDGDRSFWGNVPVGDDRARVQSLDDHKWSTYSRDFRYSAVPLRSVAAQPH